MKKIFLTYYALNYYWIVSFCYPIINELPLIDKYIDIYQLQNNFVILSYFLIFTNFLLIGHAKLTQNFLHKIDGFLLVRHYLRKRSLSGNILYHKMIQTL